MFKCVCICDRELETQRPDNYEGKKNTIYRAYIPGTILDRHVCMLSRFSHVLLTAIQWTGAHQAPLCMRFSIQEHWSGLPCPPPGNLPDPGIEPMPLTSPALKGGFITISVIYLVGGYLFPSSYIYVCVCVCVCVCLCVKRKRDYILYILDIWFVS